MASVSTSWFCASSALIASPFENQRVNSPRNFVLSMSKNTSKSGRIYSKQLPEIESTEIEQKPTNRGASNSSGTKLEEYNIAMKKMMRNPYEYHHDLGQLSSNTLLLLNNSPVLRV